MTRWLALMLCVAACKSATRGQEDAGVNMAPPTESREIVTGGVRMQGTTYTFDVQVGHPYQQSKTTSTTYTLEGNAAVKP